MPPSLSQQQKSNPLGWIVILPTFLHHFLVFVYLAEAVDSSYCIVHVENRTSTYNTTVNNSDIQPSTIPLANDSVYRINGSECFMSVTLSPPSSTQLPHPTVLLQNISILVAGGAHLPLVSFIRDIREGRCVVMGLSIIIHSVVMADSSGQALLATKETSSLSFSELTIQISDSLLFGDSGSLDDIALVQLQENATGVKVLISNTTIHLHNRILLILSAGLEQIFLVTAFNNISVVMANSTLTLEVNFIDPNAFSYHKALISVCLNCFTYQNPNYPKPPLGLPPMLSNLTISANHVVLNATVIAEYDASTPLSESFWASGAMNGTDFHLLLRLSAEHRSVKDIDIRIVNHSTLRIQAVGNLLQYNNGQSPPSSPTVNASASIELHVVQLDMFRNTTSEADLSGAIIIVSDSSVFASTNKMLTLFAINGVEYVTTWVDRLRIDFRNVNISAKAEGAVTLWTSGRGVVPVALRYLNFSNTFELVMNSIALNSTMEFGCRNCFSEVLRPVKAGLFDAVGWQQVCTIAQITESQFLPLLLLSANNRIIAMSNVKTSCDVQSSTIDEYGVVSQQTGGGYLELVSSSQFGVVLLTIEVLTITLCNISDVNVSLRNVVASASSHTDAPSGITIVTRGVAIWGGWLLVSMSIANLCSFFRNSVIHFEDVVLEEYLPFRSLITGSASTRYAASVGYTIVMASYPPELAKFDAISSGSGAWVSTNLTFIRAYVYAAEIRTEVSSDYSANASRAPSLMILPPTIMATTIGISGGSNDSTSSGRPISGTLSVVMFTLAPGGTTLALSSSITASGLFSQSFSTLFDVPTAASQLNLSPSLVIDPTSRVTIRNFVLSILQQCSSGSSSVARSSVVFACSVVVSIGGTIQLSQSSLTLRLPPSSCTPSSTGDGGAHLQMFKKSPTISPNHRKDTPVIIASCSLWNNEPLACNNFNTPWWMVEFGEGNAAVPTTATASTTVACKDYCRPPTVSSTLSKTLHMPTPLPTTMSSTEQSSAIIAGISAGGAVLATVAGSLAAFDAQALAGLGLSSCVPELAASTSPARFVVSPFYDLGSFGIVLGNTLVVIMLPCIHRIAVSMKQNYGDHLLGMSTLHDAHGFAVVRPLSSMTPLVAAAVALRFPHYSMVASTLFLPGIGFGCSALIFRSDIGSIVGGSVVAIIVLSSAVWVRLTVIGQDSSVVKLVFADYTHADAVRAVSRLGPVLSRLPPWSLPGGRWLPSERAATHGRARSAVRGGHEWLSEYALVFTVATNIVGGLPLPSKQCGIVFGAACVIPLAFLVIMLWWRPCRAPLMTWLNTLQYLLTFGMMLTTSLLRSKVVANEVTSSLALQSLAICLSLVSAAKVVHSVLAAVYESRLLQPLALEEKTTPPFVPAVSLEMLSASREMPREMIERSLAELIVICCQQRKELFLITPSPGSSPSKRKKTKSNVDHAFDCTS